MSPAAARASLRPRPRRPRRTPCWSWSTAMSSARDVGGVVIHDAAGRAGAIRRARSCSAWASTAPARAALLRELGGAGRRRARRRAPVELDRRRARRRRAHPGSRVLGLARGATWAQLAALLRSLLAEDDIGEAERESLGGLPSGDLFAVANAIAALLDAPDHDRGPLARACSRSRAARRRRTRRGPRRSSAARCPSGTRAILTERGIFRELTATIGRSSSIPSILDAEGSPPSASRSRVRAGDEVLGSIWAAMDGPLTPERAAATAGCREARRAAPAARPGRRRRAAATRAPSCRHRARGGRRAHATRSAARARPASAWSSSARRAPAADAEPAAATEQLLIATGSGSPTRWPCTCPPCAPVRPSRSSATSPTASSRRRRRRGREERAVADRARLPRPGRRPHAGRRRRSARSRRRRRHRAVPGRGRPHPPGAAPDAPTSRRGGARRRRPAGVAAARAARSRPPARGDGPTEPSRRLLAYDERHDAQLVDTLQAWLDDVRRRRRGGRRAFVHPNTFRYRLRRLAEVSGLDLADPERGSRRCSSCGC